MGRVDGKVALVTGGRRGIGAASAVMLAREGAKVAITDRKEEGSEDVLEAIAEAGGEGMFVLQDVSREEDWRRAIDEVLARFGRLDILVNNAGVGLGKNVEDADLEEWRWVMSVNLDGVFLGTKHAIAAMRKTGGGSIINMSSIEGMVGDRRLAAYDASKGGVRLLTKSAALHCARSGYGIRVNSIHPGFIDTPMVAGFLEAQGDAAKARKELESLHPLGHLGEPDDVAYAVVYLACEESKFATGSELVVDGGFTSR